MGTEPDEITIIVVAGKGLQGKKSGRHHFSVIFGVGKSKYRTQVVDHPDGNPEWNEESVIQVKDARDYVFFIVTEKEDVIGQIKIPVTALQGPPGHITHGHLQPHKKCPHPKGELIYQCNVSTYRPALVPHTSTSLPNMVSGRRRNSIATTVSTAIFKHNHENHEKKKGALHSINKKLSRSLHNLFFIEENDKNEFSSRKNSHAGIIPVDHDVNKTDKVPEIHSVSPSEGPIQGGTRLTIEGKNLGLSKADIMELLICEVDHADYVDFESSSRIFLKTKPSSAGLGDVTIETESGGIGNYKNGFKYIDPSVKNSITSKQTESNERLSTGELKQNETVQDSPKLQKSASFKMSVRFAPQSEMSETSDDQPKRTFLSHPRRKSEGNVMLPSRGHVQPVPFVSPIVQSLQAEIGRLKKENEEIEILKEQIEELNNDKKNMKEYIDKLVAKVITHCPEALSSDDDMEFMVKFG